MSGGILESRSTLNRFKRVNGLNVSNATPASGYIALCKIKKALHKEFTDVMFREYKLVNNYAKKSRLERVDKINRLLKRADSLPSNAIVRLFKIHESQGIWDLVVELDKPISILIKLANRENNTLIQNTNELVPEVVAY